MIFPFGNSSKKNCWADVNAEATRSELNIWAMHREMLSNNKT